MDGYKQTHQNTKYPRVFLGFPIYFQDTRGVLHRANPRKSPKPPDFGLSSLCFSPRATVKTEIEILFPAWFQVENPVFTSISPAATVKKEEMMLLLLDFLEGNPRIPWGTPRTAVKSMQHRDVSHTSFYYYYPLPAVKLSSDR